MNPVLERKSELIDRIVGRVRESLPEGDFAVAEPFVRQCYEGVALEDLQEAEPEGLRGAALSMFSWARTRRAGRVEVRVFNPSREEDGWDVERTIIQIATEDIPFLVDSVTCELGRRELTAHMAVHPLFTVRRDGDGKLLEIVRPGLEGEGVVAEAFMHFEVDLRTSPAALLEIETAIHQVLGDVRVSVGDWPLMRRAGFHVLAELETMPPPIPADELDETKEFLRWILDNHFTFLGYLEYSLEQSDDEEYLRPKRDTGLGLLRKLPLTDRVTSDQPVTAEASRFLHGNQLVAISKTTTQATVHRNVHMDVIAVKTFGAAGEVLGEYHFLGLFTSMAYSIAARDIPLVRRKVARVINRTRFSAASHDAKTLRHIVEHYPRDELFQISEDDLYRFSLRILELQLRPRLALLVRLDDTERFASCLVYVPRERHTTHLRIRMQQVLEAALSGEVTAFYTRVSDRPLAQVHFIVKLRPGHLPEVRVEEIEERLAEIARSWADGLKDQLTRTRGNEAGLRLWRRYCDAFPASYQETFTLGDAVRDIEIISGVLKTGRLGMRLYRRKGAAISRLHFRTFELAIPAPLSSILPMLENMGLRVNTEMPFEIRPEKAANPVWVRDFELLVDEMEVDPEGARENFQATFARLWNGEIENDPFNRLVLRAGLTWRQVVVLRACCKYLRQTGIAFSQRYMASTLARNPRIAHLLISLFFAYHDPALAAGGGNDREILEELEEALERVTSLDEDRILRRFLDLVRNTLRTNYFQHGEDQRPKEYLSLKLDASRLLDLPEPRPRYEIFVYSPHVEAVHLRGGLVARGGIRWSDRREDFRTEILGLMKSQMVKNTVIVPVGAKGGFVVKKPPASGDRDELAAEGIACYKTMIRGLLDVTDNLMEGEVVPAADVVRRDGDDTYLVVAADKGTATFSDIANSVAAEYGFWLGDAFASGGSQGYDHKKMGITARGAWESVKRHFRELGRDIQNEPFTVVAIGDMSGDVFGNGMLQSEHTKLVAAFNHLHVFVDPDPDPAASYAERRRLFELPRSSWLDYSEEALSAGGGVYERRAKKIRVSPEVKERFGLTGKTVRPDRLIQAILRAKVDLLWFGGIGTFVKGREETHSEVGDRANDDVRVDGCELGCKVVGEGANLGVTQAGRIELALAGGLINTDFIDNSGGVDCSDHEVNIKIALAGIETAAELSAEERSRLLGEMTGEVAELVLRNNYLQSHSITITELRKSAMVEEQARLMRDLERRGLLDRKLEGLPDDSTLAERREHKLGLTRPEIAVLFAYSKIFVYNELLDSGLPDDTLLVEDLVRYFPGPMQQRFRPAIERHRLRREIIATHVTNSIINRVGPTFVTRMAEQTGARVSDIARAYTAARDVFDVRALWEEIEALDNVASAELQNKMVLASIRLIEHATRWFLRYGGRPLDISGCVSRYESDIVVVAAQLEDLLPAKAKSRFRRKYKRLRSSGAPWELATRIAGGDIMPSACDVARCAQVSNVPVERVGKVYFAVGERFGFDRLRYEAGRLVGGSPWQQAAVTATLEDLFSHQAELARQVVVGHASGKTRAAIGAWVKGRSAAVQRFEGLLKDFEAPDHIDLAMLTIAERELRRLVRAYPTPKAGSSDFAHEV